MRRFPRVQGALMASPYILSFPFHGREVAVTAITGDGDDRATTLFFLQAFGDLHRRENVGSRRVSAVEALQLGDLVRHVPAIFGRDGEYLVGQTRVVDRRDDARAHVLQAFEAVERL